MGKTVLGQGIPEELMAVNLRVALNLILYVLKLLVARCFCPPSKGHSLSPGGCIN